jgi:hypothetical protein
MPFVPVAEVARRIRALQDPVLRGKVQKALHLLHRTLELYRCACVGGHLLQDHLLSTAAAASTLRVVADCSGRNRRNRPTACVEQTPNVPDICTCPHTLTQA